MAAHEMVLCRYDGLNDGGVGHLRAAKVITDKATVARWRSRFNGLPTMSDGPRSCPADDGRSMRVAFVASPDSYVILKVRLAGCSTVTGPGGVRNAMAITDDLVRLTGGA
jgi:hypothetical protein